MAREWTTPLVRLVMRIVPLKTPAGWKLAPGVSETTIEVDAPDISSPELGATASQKEVFTRLHERAPGPALARINVPLVTLYGPPSGPLDTKPCFGVILRSSGRSNASTTPAVVELAGALALKPSPRRANAVQIS